MKLPFKREEFLGNVRSGKRRENNSPCNTAYFNVYHDSYTSEYAIELFESVYKEKTNALKIIPIMNIVINNEVYLKEIKCRGEIGKKATRIVEKGKKIEGICNPEKCQYYSNGQCNRKGTLYFRIVGIEDSGIWCYSTKSSGLYYIENYLNLMIKKGIDITENQFLLTLNEKYGQSGKVYVPDIKMIKDSDKKSSQNGVNPEKSSNNSAKSKEVSKVKSLYTYIEGKMVDYKSQRIPRLEFKNNNNEKFVFYLTKNSKKDILKLSVGSKIEIKKVCNNKNKEMFLLDYNIIKKVEKKAV